MTSKILTTLTKIVSSKSAKAAESAITDTFKHIGAASAVNVRKDVQEFIDGAMPENELRHYLSQVGIA